MHYQLSWDQKIRSSLRRAVPIGLDCDIIESEFELQSAGAVEYTDCFFAKR